MSRCLRFEILEVSTPQERQGYDRTLIRVYRKEFGWGKKRMDKFDSYFSNHKRFIACLVDGEPGRVIGTGMLAENNSKGKQTVSRLAVLEEFRQRGVASAIGQRLEDEALAMGLTEVILFCVERKIDYYLERGFQLIENIGREPEDKEDSFLLLKKLY
jgi:N-acetylglutamate synthase-like GNAT family acetyltransferase